MRQFFGKHNRDKHFLMLLLWECVRVWKEDKESQLTPKERRKIEYALKHLWDVSEMILARLGIEYGKALIKDLGRYKVEVVRDTKIVEGETIVKDVDLFEIYNFAIYACNSQSPERCIHYKRCRLYKAMRAANIPVTVIETDACPYRGAKYDRKTKKWTDVCPIPLMERKCKQSVCSVCGQVWQSDDPADWSEDTCPECEGLLGEWR